MRTTRIAVLVSLCALCALRAAAQPLGAEFRVNGYTTFHARMPAVASDPTGAFVVVWSSTQLGTSGAIFGQRFSSAGAPLGSEFRINQFTADTTDYYPAVARASSGAFVVVWEGLGKDGYGFGIQGQRFDAAGAPLGAEFAINTTIAMHQQQPDVAAAPNGDFVVVWESNEQDGSNNGIYGQRYASDGTKQGAEFRVNTYTTNQQQYPSVARDSTGAFIVVWNSNFQEGADGVTDVYGQRYSAAGAPLGAEFRVNTYTTNIQTNARVAVDGTGRFVVVWESHGQTGGLAALFAQRYAANGEPDGGELRVNAAGSGSQDHPAIASDAAGNLVVAWNGYTSFNSGTDVDLRQGTQALRFGTDLRVNAYTSGTQSAPAAAFLASGDFVVVWHTTYQFGIGSGLDVMARRYHSCQSSDVNGDAKLDVADVFYLINYLFAGSSAPVCGGDVNGDAKVDVGDVFYLINFLFAGGPPPIQ